MSHPVQLCQSSTVNPGLVVTRWLASLVMTCLFGLAAAGVSSAAEAEDVVFRARNDGSEQRYVVRLPPEFRDEVPHGLLIALHGHGSDRWQFVWDGRDECRAARDAADRHGLIYVSPDYRARTSWMGPQAEQDVLQILEELRAKYRISHFIVSGGSMGGTSALTFAALHPDLVAGVVALNPHANHLEYDRFQDAIAASFGGSKVEKLIEYKNRSAEYWPERFTMPLAITTGGRDNIVPPDSALRLAAVLKRLDREILVIHRPEGGHATDYADTLAAYEFVIERAGKGKKE